MAQFARPIATDVAGGWLNQSGSGTNLHLNVDETVASDADYVHDNLSGTTLRFSLTSLTDPLSSSGHVMRWRYQWADGSNSFNLTLRLKENTTTRVTRTILVDIGVVGFTSGSYTLSGAEADSITNYTNLKYEMLINQVSFDEQINISWLEFEVPDAPVGGQPTGGRFGHQQRILPYTAIKGFGR